MTTPTLTAAPRPIEIYGIGDNPAVACDVSPDGHLRCDLLPGHVGEHKACLDHSDIMGDRSSPDWLGWRDSGACSNDSDE